MRRSPAEAFARYLVLRGLSNIDVRTMLAEKRLDVVDEEYLERLRATMAPPAPFRPDDPTDLRSQRFLVRCGLRPLFRPGTDMRLATSLLDLARPRELAETLILSGATPEWTASALRRRGTEATPRSILWFKRFFFEIDALDTTDMQVVLSLRQCGGTPEEAALRAAGQHQAPRQLAARAQCGSLGTLMALLRAGALPRDVQVARLLKATLVAASASALEAVLRDDGRRAHQYAAVVRASTEALQVVGDPDGDLRHDLAAVLLRTDEKQLPHVSELGGEHTVDLEPKPLAADATASD